MTPKHTAELREAAEKVAEHIAKPGPWECDDRRYGPFSGVAVYAAGNAHPWRMAEVQGPSVEAEKAIAQLIALASPDRIIALLDAFEECVKALKEVDRLLASIGMIESGTHAHGLIRAAISKALP